MGHAGHHRHHHHARDSHLDNRDDTMPSPLTDLPVMDTEPSPTLAKRDPAPAKKSCGPDDTTGACERPADKTLTRTVPIVLCVVVPLVIAFIAFIYLHRRNVKRLRNEDANDKHKSLDFGLDPVSGAGKNKKGHKQSPAAAEQSGAEQGEKGLRPPGHGGLSMDMSMEMSMGSPYVLPPGLHGSRESLHSLSRTMTGNDDRYRPATAFPSENGSVRTGGPRHAKDDSSSMTARSWRHGYSDDMGHGLLHNAQGMPQSPQTPASQPSSQPAFTLPVDDGPGIAPMEPRAAPSPEPATLNDNQNAANPTPEANPSSDKTHDPLPAPKNDPNLRNSHDYLSSFIHSGSSRGPSPGPSETKSPPPPRTASLSHNDGQYPKNTDPRSPSPPVIVEPPRQGTSPPAQSPPASSYPPPPRISLTLEGDKSADGDKDAAKSQRPAPPQLNIHLAEPQNPTAAKRMSATDDDIYDPYTAPDPKRMTMGLRPLPPEDPSDNPEQRANRIRSFYKEYFDDSKPFTEEYYEDYGPEYDYYGYDDYYDYDDDYYYGYDDGLAEPHAPFAQGMGRRAMTPPPRMPPRFAPGPRGAGAASAFGYAEDPYHRGFGSMSSVPGPRAFSSASARGPGRKPAKPLPPPAPLQELPTPHKLKDDTSILPAVEFAPGTGAKDRRAGRPETPQGGLRPYMPAVPVHSPLAGSYDDLAAMPSPHALRKSGTFTALDFAAPKPRFRGGQETASETGSIRSNRSGVSAAHMHNIRTGAYRVSRLPQDTVGTKQNITAGLHPTWDLKR